jgi:hypothetical protein
MLRQAATVLQALQVLQAAMELTAAAAMVIMRT